MSDVIKRGRLDVKKRNIFGSAYKNRWVLLRNSLTLNCKTVEILEGDDETEDTRDVIRLSEPWSVQEKPSKTRGRCTVELLKGEEVLLTFSCATMEREEWLESFRVLKQLALPCSSVGQNSPTQPGQDYFAVTLLKNRNAIEINHSGAYLLSITDAAIVLHWRTGAIAHHWPKRSVHRLLHHPKKDGHLILHANRSAGRDDLMEFEFTTTKESAVQILKTWNIRLLESFAFNPQQLNEIASVINPTVPAPKKDVKSKSSKSFRKNKPNNKYRQDDSLIKRSGSFSKTQTYRTDINNVVGAAVGPGSAGSSPAVMRNRNGELVRVGGLPPLPREANVRSDEQYGTGAAPLGNLSQESYGRGSAGASPPPLPPRPSDRLRMDSLGCSPNGEDPDYAYIKEDNIKPPPSKPLDPSASVDDALNELEKDIMRANEARRIEEEDRRRREARQRARLSDHIPLRLGPQVVPPISEPQDYMDFVPQDYTDFKPTKTLHSMSVSSDPDKTPATGPSHARSASEPDPVPYQPSSKTHSQPPVFEDDEDTLKTVGLNQAPLGQKPISKSSHHLSGRSQSEQAFYLGGPIPSLPPRTWRHATSSGNIDADPSVVAGGSTDGSVSSLVTVAENRPRTSQDVHTGVSSSLSKPLSRGSSDLAIPQYSTVQKPKSIHRNSDVRLDTSPAQYSTATSVQSAPTLPTQQPMTAHSLATISNPAQSSTNSQSSTTPRIHSVTTSLPTNLSSNSSSPASMAASAPSQSLRDTITFQAKPSTPPPIPPRSPTKEHLSRKSSSSSSSSGSSNNRCSHCRNSRRPHKAQVSKTVSLGAALSSNQSPDNCRKSLPDLAGSDNTVLENQLNRHGGHRRQRSRHCSRCSPESSMETLQDELGTSASTSSLSGSTPLEYLQLVGEDQGKEDVATSKSDMDLMNSCMKYLDFLNREIDVTVSLSNQGGISEASTVPPPARVTSSSSRPFVLPSSVTSHARPKPTTTQPLPPPAIGGSVFANPPTPMNPGLAAANKKRSVGMDKKSLEMNLSRAQLEAQMTLASLSQPLNSAMGSQGIGLLPVSSHTDFRTSPVLNYGHSSSSSNAHHLPAATTSHAAVSRVTRSPQNGGHVLRSVSTTALMTTPTGNIHSSAPPIVPPRSMVSLKKDPPTTTAAPTNKRQMSPRTTSATQLRTHGTSFNTSNSMRMSGGPGNQQHPMRSPRMNSRHASLMRPSRQRDQLDPGQSSTVFIHHLKGGLTHLV